MYIKSHYCFTNECVIDLEIRESRNGEGHIVSILAQKGRDSITQYILHPHNFAHLKNPQIISNTYDCTVGDKDLLIQVYEQNDTIPSVYFFLDSRTYTATVIAGEGKSKIQIKI